jgi:hypothetical protein
LIAALLAFASAIVVGKSTAAAKPESAPAFVASTPRCAPDAVSVATSEKWASSDWRIAVPSAIACCSVAGAAGSINDR